MKFSKENEMKRIKNVNRIGTSLVILAISSSACVALAQSQNMSQGNSSNNGAITQSNNDTMNENSDSHNVSGSRANTSNTGVSGGEISNLNTVSQNGGYTGSGQTTGSTSSNSNMSKTKPWKSRTSSEPQGTTDSTRNYLK